MLRVIASRPTRFLLVLLSLLLAGCATTNPQHRSTSVYNYGSIAQPSRPWPELQSDFGTTLRGSILALEALPNGGLRLRAPSARAFETDGKHPSKALGSALQQLGNLLKRYRELDATVVGHTDSQGSELYNQARSLQQAEVVAQALMAEGIPFNRVRTEGHGEAEPIADNSTADGRTTNQRVEILIRAAAPAAEPGPTASGCAPGDGLLTENLGPTHPTPDSRTFTASSGRPPC